MYILSLEGYSRGGGGDFLALGESPCLKGQTEGRTSILTKQQSNVPTLQWVNVLNTPCLVQCLMWTLSSWSDFHDCTGGRKHFRNCLEANNDGKQQSVISWSFSKELQWKHSYPGHILSQYNMIVPGPSDVLPKS